jgi:hypothetical protein
MLNFKDWLKNENVGQPNFTPPSNSLRSEPGYVYHATNHNNLYEIIHSGHLDVFDPWHGTEQDEWPDGSTEPRSYWSNNIATTQYFVPMDGKAVIIRTKFNPQIFRVETGTKDIYSTQRIPISALEALVDNQWTPLNKIN